MDYFSMKKRFAGGGSLWYSLDGYSDKNVLGAWKFKGRNSQSDALKDLSNNGRTLTNSGCAWDSGSGFYANMSNYLDHSSLRSSGWIKSLVMKIHTQWGGNYKALTGGWGGLSVWLKTPFETQSFAWKYTGFGIGHTKGLSIDYNNDSANVHGTLARENVRIGSEISGTCVVGISNTGWGAIYINGASKSLSNASASGYPWTRWQQGQVDIPRLVGGTGAVNSVTMNGYFYITALAAYDIVLSQAQHQAIYTKLLEI